MRITDKKGGGHVLFVLVISAKVQPPMTDRIDET